MSVPGMFVYQSQCESRLFFHVSGDHRKGVLSTFTDNDPAAGSKKKAYERSLDHVCRAHTDGILRG